MWFCFCEFSGEFHSGCEIVTVCFVLTFSRLPRAVLVFNVKVYGQYIYERTSRWLDSIGFLMWWWWWWFKTSKYARSFRTQIINRSERATLARAISSKTVAVASTPTISRNTFVLYQAKSDAACSRFPFSELSTALNHSTDKKTFRLSGILLRFVLFSWPLRPTSRVTLKFIDLAITHTAGILSQMISFSFTEVSWWLSYSRVQSVDW